MINTFAQSQFLDNNKSAYGVFLTADIDVDTYPGITFSGSVERKIDIAFNITRISHYRYTNYIATFGAAFYPLEYLEKNIFVSLGLSFGFSKALKGGGGGFTQSVGLVGYKQVKLSPVVTWVPEINVNNNYIQDRDNLTTVSYGFSLGFNLNRNTKYGYTDQHDESTIAIEVATSKIEDQRVYYIGVGLIFR